MENLPNLSLDLGVVLGGLQGGKLLSRQRKVEKGRVEREKERVDLISLVIIFVLNYKYEAKITLNG